MPPDGHFTVIGTEVQSDHGTVAAPLAKRRALFALSAQALQLPRVSQDLHRSLLALFVHPFMHRRELMCVFGSSYSWLAAQSEGRTCELRHDVRGHSFAVSR